MDKCKHCGNELKHVEGRKKKAFCNVNCRNKYFYASRKSLIETAKKMVRPATIVTNPILTRNDILDQLKILEAEKIPTHISSEQGKVWWQQAQRKKITELKAKLNNK